ncbi:adenylate/guanylate cyclase domain-containing protein [Aliikangiella marina]|uniref:Adenylate/guanylate cyclase domain-containing protein n=1 Tax=Aliikangiella marina TaxID=1712262 RepID=A0A545T978_9GAMM|nr:adenylate/guanylate cyclase domain-containing protein [Aliikangiella marina]TQV73748.1 adenylate/guanylate cyclase domain-containing protein [Aliikangiella marina]
MASFDKIIKRNKRKAILFADISGSSALYKERGNLEAKTIVDSHLESLAELIEQAKGKVIKTIGDEVMACFDDCDRCLYTAIQIQKRVIDSFRQDQIELSIGIGFGEVLSDKGDLFGEAVNDAAHLTHLAKGGQILISESCCDRLEPVLKMAAREFDRIKLKGAQQVSTIYRVYWQADESQDSETQLMSGKMVNQSLNIASLTVEYQGVKNVISENHTPFVIGRDSRKCQLLVEGSQVSREHCTIDFQRGKFVLIDHSTNGCYLAPADKSEFYIRREEYPVIDSSKLSLGISTKENAADVILLYY